MDTPLHSSFWLKKIGDWSPQQMEETRDQISELFHKTPAAEFVTDSYQLNGLDDDYTGQELLVLARAIDIELNKYI